jgi:hypothetical protein
VAVRGAGVAGHDSCNGRRTVTLNHKANAC